MDKTADRKKIPETIKTLIKGYSSSFNLIPGSEWLDLAKKFKQAVDNEDLSFDTSLSRFCENLCNINLDIILNQKYDEVDIINGDVNPEIIEDIFKSVNLGVLYGYALGKLLYDDSIESGEILSAVHG